MGKLKHLPIAPARARLCPISHLMKLSVLNIFTVVPLEYEKMTPCDITDWLLTSL